MPELPEVETLARELATEVRGRHIVSVQVFRDTALGGRAAADFGGALVDKCFLGAWRRGKFLILSLEPQSYLVAHLRMTGKFVLSPALPKPRAHHRVWFGLDDGQLLVFQDMRCFGTLEVANVLDDVPALAKLGIEPLTGAFTARWLHDALRKTRAPIKPWLMDQSRIAGVGNIYAAEACHAAGLHPAREGRSCDQAELRRLHRGLRRILRKAISKSGTTISDFRRVDEKTGEFQNYLRVYGKAGQPCPRCRVPIGVIRQQQRSSFFCPGCQR